MRQPAVGLSLLVGLTAACAAASGTAGTPSDITSPTAADDPAFERLITLGQEVYGGQYCGVCHRLDSAGTGGTFGPPHNGIGSTAERRIRDPRYAGKATTAEGYLRESIIDPASYPVPGYEHTRYRMPAYTNLGEQELHALVQMLLRETEEPE